MNNSYYNPMFPGSAMPSGTPNQQTVPSIEENITNIPITAEQSYVENILRLNKGKLAKFYMSFPDSDDWGNKIFTGIIEQAGRDHIIISDPNTGDWHLLLMIYLNFVDFQEPINYVPVISPYATK